MPSGFYTYFLAFSRWACALLSLFFILSYLRYYLSNKSANNIFAKLLFKNGSVKNLTNYENVIGKGNKADIKIQNASIKGRHAVIYAENNKWYLAPVQGKVGINQRTVNSPNVIHYGDLITVGNTAFEFKEHKQLEDISSKQGMGAQWSLVFLSLLQIIMGITLSLRYSAEINPIIPISFTALIAGEWIYFIALRGLKNSKMLMELCILYLSTVGLAVCSTAAPDRLFKQVICYVVGFGGYLAFTLFLKSGYKKSVFQAIAMIASLILLYITAFFGSEINSSKNWLSIGSFSFQPSELCKVAFVFAGCTTLYIAISSKKIQWGFIIYSILCMGALALMLDFGAVAIFFIGMFVLLSLRLTNPVITGGICIGFGALGLAVIAVYPYILRRFEVWLHAWEYANAGGYQQTRTMIAAASGGLLGVGGGNGYLSSITASETDLVFGIVCEEWGSVMGITVAFCIVMLGLYAYKLAKNSVSLFYSCGVCASAVMLVFQSALNIFGSLDILPLTGVTLVFISCGGTSIISAFLMMSFYKAAEIAQVFTAERRRVR